MEYVALLIGLLVLSAFFSSSETAFLSLQRLKLEHYVREGRPGAKAVSSLLLQPGKLLSAILIGNNLVNAAAATMTRACCTSPKFSRGTSVADGGTKPLEHG